MSRLGRTFFTADTLFSDERAANERQFGTVEEMDEALVAAWNAVVGPGDIVWILGNFHTAGLVPQAGRVRGLNGSKYLIAGEADKVFHGNVPDARRLKARVDYFRELGFAGVVTGSGIARKFGQPIRLPLRTRQDNEPLPVIVSPFTYDITEPGDRFARWRPQRPKGGSAPWLLHGAAEWRYTRDGQFNISADSWGLEPVDAQIVLDMIEEAEAGEA